MVLICLSSRVSSCAVFQSLALPCRLSSSLPLFLSSFSHPVFPLLPVSLPLNLALRLCPDPHFYFLHRSSINLFQPLPLPSPSPSPSSFVFPIPSASSSGLSISPRFACSCPSSSSSSSSSSSGLTTSQSRPPPCFSRSLCPLPMLQSSFSVAASRYLSAS